MRARVRACRPYHLPAISSSLARKKVPSTDIAHCTRMSAEGVHIYIWRARQTASVRQRVPQRAICGPHHQAHCVRGAAHADGKRGRARSESGRAPGVGTGAQLTVAWRTMGVLRKNELGGLSLCAASAAAPAVAPTAAAADAPARTLQEMHSSRYEGELQPMLLRRAAAQRAARGPRGAARSARGVARARARTNTVVCVRRPTPVKAARLSPQALAAGPRAKASKRTVGRHQVRSGGQTLLMHLQATGGSTRPSLTHRTLGPGAAATTPSLDDGGRLGDVHDVAVSGRARLRRCVAVAI